MKANQVSQGEAIRRALWVFRVLYADNLSVKDALAQPFDPYGPLHAALKPIPELSHHIGLEFELWRKQSRKTAT
jgi:hypothetical protein